MRRLVPAANPLVLLAMGTLAIVASFAVRDLRTAAVALGAYVLAGVLLLPSPPELQADAKSAKPARLAPRTNMRYFRMGIPSHRFFEGVSTPPVGPGHPINRVLGGATQ